jgi:cephalosporin hydroxylase
MSEARASVRRLLESGRAYEAMRAAEAALESSSSDIGLLALRADCLAAVGQFEVALDVARVVLVREPENPEALRLTQALEPVLEPPSFGSPRPLDRPYRSELPNAMLVRMQKALHHQRYRGCQMVKSPFDVMLYIRMVEVVRPRTIIEIGSKAGGSGLFFGDLIANHGIDGHVHSLDIVPVLDVTHPNVTFAYGNGRDLSEVLAPERIAAMPRPLVVVEDADHTVETTSAVLAFFHENLIPGDWLVIEDGNLSDVAPDLYPEWTSGPHRALRAFFREHAADYRIGAEYCDFYAYNGTTASNGFLERLAGEGVRD